MQPFIAQICIFGFNFPPQNWTLCYGQLLSISQYNAVFALVGTFYGGNGRTDFGVPDLRGRFPMGMGTGPGLLPAQIGWRGGLETHVLSTSQMPQHTHTATFTPTSPSPITASMKVYKASAQTNTPSTGDWISGKSTGPDIFAPNGAFGAEEIEISGLEVSGGGSSGGTVTNANTGSSDAFSIRNPYQVMNFSFALDGIFPSRN